MHLTFAAVVMATDVPMKVLLSDVHVQNESVGLKKFSEVSQLMKESMMQCASHTNLC